MLRCLKGPAGPADRLTTQPPLKFKALVTTSKALVPSSNALVTRGRVYQKWSSEHEMLEHHLLVVLTLSGCDADWG